MQVQSVRQSHFKKKKNVNTHCNPTKSHLYQLVQLLDNMLPNSAAKSRLKSQAHMKMVLLTSNTTSSSARLPKKKKKTYISKGMHYITKVKQHTCGQP